MPNKELFEKIYKEENAVWTRKEPQREIKEIVKNKKVKPCKMIDIGCGEGYYSLYFASKGFDVLGIDLSENAISYAKQNVKNKDLKIRFKQMDITNLDKLKAKFDFVFEWGVMHHIMPDKRNKYVKDVLGILNNSGKYLSVSFNRKSPEFEGPGKKYRKSPIGTKLYYSSEKELEKLFKKHFQIINSKIIEMIGGKGQGHVGNYFLMKK